MTGPVPQPRALPGLVATGATALVLPAGILLDGTPPQALRWASLALLALSVPLFVLPFRHLPRHGAAQPSGSYMDTTRVAERGVYGAVRHPQYLGYVLLATGFGVLAWHPVALALDVVAVAGFFLQMLEEEHFLSQRFGSDYRSYMDRVPRLNLVAGLWRLWRPRRPRPR